MGLMGFVSISSEESNAFAINENASSVTLDNENYALYENRRTPASPTKRKDKSGSPNRQWKPKK